MRLPLSAKNSKVKSPDSMASLIGVPVFITARSVVDWISIMPSSRSQTMVAKWDAGYWSETYTTAEARVFGSDMSSSSLHEALIRESGISTVPPEDAS